jgi:hypothetical protein
MEKGKYEDKKIMTQIYAFWLWGHWRIGICLRFGIVSARIGFNLSDVTKDE